MTALFGKPRMTKTRTPGMMVGWKQGLYEKTGVGTLFIEVLGETEYEFSPCPRTYFNDLRMRPDGVDLMNSLMIMYLGRGLNDWAMPMRLR